jgi:hypothetical protein
MVITNEDGTEVEEKAKMELALEKMMTQITLAS